MCISHVRARIISGCLLLCFYPAMAAGAAKNFLGLSGGFSQGDFGTGVDTSLYRLQIDYGQIIGPYNFSLSVPYLVFDDSTGYESGLGDITLQAGISFNEDVFARNSFYASVSLKLPTADDADALGTGETDIGGLIGYTGRFNDVSINLAAGYIVTGDTPTQSYNDVFVYSAGLAVHTYPWYVYARLDGQQATIDAEDAPLELSGGFLYQVKTKQFINVEVFAGLSDSSPDTGFNIGLVNWF